MEMTAVKHDPVEFIRSLKDKQYRSLGTELERQARERGNKTAIIFEERSVTFSELNALANRYANFFASLGFKHGDVVALYMENRPEYLIAASGLSKLGVIVSLINNGLKGPALAHALNICDARAVIVGGEYLEELLSVRKNIVLRSPALLFVEAEGRRLSLPPGIEDIGALLEYAREDDPPTTGEISTEDVIVYIYTSGTTGMPKACAVTQKRWLLLANLGIQIGHMEQEGVHYVALPLYHNSGFNVGYSALIFFGNTMLLRRNFSATAFWDDVRRYNVLTFIYVGEMCRYIYNQLPKPDDADNPLRCISGTGIRGDLIVPFKERFGVEWVTDTYGTTEGVGLMVNLEGIPGICGNLTVNGLRQGEIVKWDFEKECILRDENDYAVRCSPGEAGLLVCEINDRNPFVGYVNNPEATEAKVLRNLLEDGDKFFDTGDLVKLHERGNFSFVDRLGDNYRWKSENISTNMVSSVIDGYGHIEDANVYGVEVPGMEGRCGMAALKLLKGESIDWEEFSAHITANLAPYARPYFLRLRPVIDANNSFKQVKKNLQKEGFDPAVVSDPLYFLHPERKQYVPLTPEIYEDIIGQKFRF
ncbi:MAG: long-chain-acyl-CoA synthetase [Deltaproteobacteria bacterium]